LSTEFDRAYEVLGVKPGVSTAELKAAHRDLAKVWHPDRFLHDPRLQQKAQDKLKEINEAYEQLISRHKRRVPPPPPPQPRQRQQRPQPRDVARVHVRRGVGWHWWLAAPFAVFALVFAFTTKTLIRQPQSQPVESAPVAEESTEPSNSTRPEANHTARVRDENNSTPATQTTTEPAPASEPSVAVPTVTVLIDPESGRLATPACPVKSRMTYPSGSEPHGYCNIPHVLKPEKKTGLKGLAKRISEID
jgi:hypothetical protein